MLRTAIGTTVIVSSSSLPLSSSQQLPVLEGQGKMAHEIHKLRSLFTLTDKIYFFFIRCLTRVLSITVS